MKSEADDDADLRRLFRVLREHDDAAMPAPALAHLTLAVAAAKTAAETTAETAPAASRAARPGSARRARAARWFAAGTGLAAAAWGFWLLANLRPVPADEVQVDRLAQLSITTRRMPSDGLMAPADITLPRLSWATLPTSGLARSPSNLDSITNHREPR